MHPAQKTDASFLLALAIKAGDYDCSPDLHKGPTGRALLPITPSPRWKIGIFSMPIFAHSGACVLLKHVHNPSSLIPDYSGAKLLSALVVRVFHRLAKRLHSICIRTGGGHPRRVVQDGRALRVDSAGRPPDFLIKVRTDGAIHRYSLRAMSDHILLHCLWAYGKGRGQLSAEESAHLTACEGCTRALQVCRQEKNFGAVLRELNRATDDNSGEKPKLKSIYVFPGPISLLADNVRKRTD